MLKENDPRAYTSRIKEAPIAKYVYTPYIREYLSTHKINSLLDIDCRDGSFCRLSKQLNVPLIIGIDEQASNIAYAKEQQHPEDLSMEFQVADVNNLSLHQDFSLVLAFWSTCKCTSKEQVEQLMKALFIHTEKGGKSLLVMCDASKMTDLKVRTQFSHHFDFPSEPITEGSPYHVRIDTKEQYVEFTDYFWQPQTIVKLLKSAGFIATEIKYLNVSDEGIRDLGKDYWECYEANPYMVIIEAST